MIVKSTLTLALLGLLLTGTAQADEMTVNLRSGNSLIIRYTGTIQGVTMHGDSDGIAGIDMPATAEQSNAQPSQIEQPYNKPQNSKGTEIRLRWADPIEENNPFPRRE